MDQGIIQNLKQHYRSNLTKQIITDLEEKNKIKCISLLDAILLISKIWNEYVLQITIKNCFRKAGFLHKEIDTVSCSEIEDYNDNISDTELENEYLQIDDDVATTNEFDIDNLDDVSISGSSNIGNDAVCNAGNI